MNGVASEIFWNLVITFMVLSCVLGALLVALFVVGWIMDFVSFIQKAQARNREALAKAIAKEMRS